MPKKEAKATGLTGFDKLVILVLVLLGLIPFDPLDLIDFGTPLLEGAGLIGYILFRVKDWGLKLF
jgi:hypothetical protein